MCRALDLAGHIASFWAHVNISYRIVSLPGSAWILRSTAKQQQLKWLNAPTLTPVCLISCVTD